MNPGAAFRSHSDFSSSQGSLLRERRWPATLPPAPRASIYRQEGKKPGKGKLPLAAGAAQPQHSEDLRRKKKKKGIHALKCPYQSLRSCKGFRSSPRSLALPPGWSPQCHHGWYREMPLPLPGHRQPRHSSREMRRVPRRFYPYLLFSFIFTFF